MPTHDDIAKLVAELREKSWIISVCGRAADALEALDKRVREAEARGAARQRERIEKAVSARRDANGSKAYADDEMVANHHRARFYEDTDILAAIREDKDNG